MKKTTTTLTALTLLTLTGCGLSSNNSPQPAPEATHTVASPTPEKKYLYAGTTFQGADINFTILPEQTQAEQNDANQATGITGAWGKLCSSQATVEQLTDIGVRTAAGGNLFYWRSLKHAVPEDKTGISEKDAIIIPSVAHDDLGQKCVVVLADSEEAMNHHYDTVTIGQYADRNKLTNTTTAK